MSKPTRNTKSKNRGKMQDEDTVDCSRISSSSISSSDSEAGLITNDEDREGMVGELEDEKYTGYSEPIAKCWNDR